MNEEILMTIATVQTHTTVSGGSVSYLIGGIVALLLMGYLIYSLLRPDKF